MQSLFKIAVELFAAAQEKRVRARLLTQLDERTLRDIGLEQEANRAKRERATASCASGCTDMAFSMQGQLALARGRMLRLEDVRGMTVTVTIGSLWITQEGDRRDHHLGPGGSFRIDAPGLTLISALRRSVISL